MTPNRLTYRTRASLVLRVIVLCLLVLALISPTIPLPGRDTDVVFVVDHSASMGAAGRQAALDWVARALPSRDDDDRAAVVLFGRDAQVGYRLTTTPPGGVPPVRVLDDATDAERAVRLAAGMLGQGSRRRVVVLSDGRMTQGNLDQAAAQLAEAGIGLDIVTVGQAGVGDVLLEGMTAPAQVREGETYSVEVVLRNDTTTSASGTLTLSADGTTISEQAVELPPGRSTVVIDHVSESSGLDSLRAELRSGASTVERNDAAAAAVQVAGPPKVLLIDADEVESAPVIAALKAEGIGVDRRASDQGVPGVAELVTYDSVVLVNLPADAVGTTGMKTLDSAVRDAGVGLVTVGGVDAYGMGDYRGTVLEDLLPVSSQITDPLRRPSVAEALVVDSSESMGACHCQDNGNGPIEEDPGAVNKTEIARQAVRRAITQLADYDTVGVLAFDTDSRWVVPLQQVPNDSVVDNGLAQLHPSGNTDIPQAVRTAIAGLRETDAELRHIVLFSDGFMGDLSGLVPVAEEAAESGMTLSVVGTGEGSFPELAEMADVGGGRYYPGRNLSEVPDILAAEVMQVSRPLVNEGEFLPTITGIGPATAGLEAAPPLFGFVATSPKPAARRLLAVGEFNDPLLATWQAGLGRVTSWTSDSAGRWSAGWVDWPGYQSFWSAVVKDTFPEALDDSLDAQVSVQPDGLSIQASLPGDVTGTSVTATVVDEEGVRHQTPLARDPEGGFSGSLPAEAEGVHLVTVSATAGDGQPIGRAVVPAVRAYPAEFGTAVADEAGLRQAAERTGGMVDVAPSQTFRREGLQPGTGGLQIWPWLVSLALILAVAEVGVRRLRLERADFGWLARLAAVIPALGPSGRRAPGGRGRPAKPTGPLPGPPGATRRVDRQRRDTPPQAAPTAAADLPDQPPIDEADTSSAQEPEGGSPSRLAGLRDARDKAFDSSRRRPD